MLARGIQKRAGAIAPILEQNQRMASTVACNRLLNSTQSDHTESASCGEGRPDRPAGASGHEVIDPAAHRPALG